MSKAVTLPSLKNLCYALILLKLKGNRIRSTGSLARSLDKENWNSNSLSNLLLLGLSLRVEAIYSYLHVPLLLT